MLNVNIIISDIVNSLNSYFFDADEITVSDGLWFYGITLLVAIIGLAFLVLNLIG